MIWKRFSFTFFALRFSFPNLKGCVLQGVSRPLLDGPGSPRTFSEPCSRIPGIDAAQFLGKSCRSLVCISFFEDHLVVTKSLRARPNLLTLSTLSEAAPPNCHYSKIYQAEEKKERKRDIVLVYLFPFLFIEQQKE